MHGWTVKKVYYYALSFILVAFIIYNVGQIVWRLSEIIVPPPILDLESRKVNTYSNWENDGRKHSLSGSVLPRILVPLESGTLT